MEPSPVLSILHKYTAETTEEKTGARYRLANWTVPENGFKRATSLCGDRRGYQSATEPSRW